MFPEDQNEPTGPEPEEEVLEEEEPTEEEPEEEPEPGEELEEEEPEPDAEREAFDRWAKANPEAAARYLQAEEARMTAPEEEEEPQVEEIPEEEEAPAAYQADEANEQAATMVRVQRENHRSIQNMQAKDAAIRASYAEVEAGINSLTEDLGDQAAGSPAYRALTGQLRQMEAEHAQLVADYHELLKDAETLDEVRAYVSAVPSLAPYQKDLYELMKSGKITSDMSLAKQHSVIREHRLRTGRPPVKRKAKTPKQDDTAHENVMQRFDKLRVPKTTPAKAGTSASKGGGTKERKFDLTPEQKASLDATWR